MWHIYVHIYIGERRDSYRVLLGKPEGKNRLEKLGIAGRIILKKRSYKHLIEMVWTGLIWLRIGPDGRPF